MNGAKIIEYRNQTSSLAVRIHPTNMDESLVKFVAPGLVGPRTEKLISIHHSGKLMKWVGLRSNSIEVVREDGLIKIQARGLKGTVFIKT